MSFEKLNLIQPIQKALKDLAYEIPTPIQSQAIPVILERKDLLGSAQTGTGKTAAYAIPILQILRELIVPGKEKRPVSALVLAPTRELALQISDSFTAYGKYAGLRNAVIYGGVPQKRQTDKLRKGCDILVATPGRLLDLMEQKYIDLKDIKVLVLDEADRMLDMGFIHDIKKIVSSTPKERQTLFFSATMPAGIIKLAGSILKYPVKVEISPEKPTVDAIKQGLYYVPKKQKKDLLLHLLQDSSIESALVFTRTKHGADKVEKFLNGAKIKANAIHGDKSQGARQRALDDFKKKKTRVLVATDIAARGIDVEELTHVINYELPDQSENYIHRIGRTGRAGQSGIAISFCEPEEKNYLKDINKLISKPIPVMKDNPFPAEETAPANVLPLSEKKNKGKSSHRKNDRPKHDMANKSRHGDNKANKSRRGDNKVEKSWHNDDKVNKPWHNDDKVSKSRHSDDKVSKSRHGDDKVNKPKQGDRKFFNKKRGDGTAKIKKHENNEKNPNDKFSFRRKKKKPSKSGKVKVNAAGLLVS